MILINGSSVPENFTGLIIQEHPSHILIVDAVLLNDNKTKNEFSGKILNLDEDEIAKYGFSTHSISLNFLIEYLRTHIDFKVFILGVEVESMNFGMELTENMENSLFELQNNLIEILEKID
ncbi:MAG: conserved hypothetical protein partial [Methanobrevibacter sp. CfCl-M3]